MCSGAAPFHAMKKPARIKLPRPAQLGVAALTAASPRKAGNLAGRHAVELTLRQSLQRAHRLLKQSQQRQARLRLVSHRILQAQEDERRKISRELHDDISQVLVGIDVHLANFERSAVITPRGIRRSLAPLRRMVAESIGIVHRFARDLRPAMLDDLGLIPALSVYLEHLPAPQRRRIRFVPFAGVEAMREAGCGQRFAGIPIRPVPAAQQSR